MRRISVMVVGAFVLLFSANSLCAQEEIPSWFHGVWKGRILQTFPSGTMEHFNVTIYPQKDHFEIISDGYLYRCKGRWVIESSNNEELVFTQVIIKNGRLRECVLDTKIVISVKNGSVKYRSEGEEIGICEGVMEKTARGVAFF